MSREHSRRARQHSRDKVGEDTTTGGNEKGTQTPDTFEVSNRGAGEIGRRMIARRVRIAIPPRLDIVETDPSGEQVASGRTFEGIERGSVSAISAVQIELRIVEAR
jgi:hypothetical protein